jgi:localization factor PodJL
MSAGAPWSVKGIDAKAREVAKDLARRSGLTLGEWLNQMILEGEDVGAAIRRERERMAAPASSRGESGRREPEYRDSEYDDGYVAAEPVVRRRPPVYREVQNDIAPPPRRAPAFSSGAQPLSSRDLRRRSIFEGRSQEDWSREERYREGRERPEGAADMGRVANALESLSSRIEGSETRSASAVRGVSTAVEALLNRLERSEAALERSEAAHGETRERLEEAAHEIQSSFQSRFEDHEESREALASRLEQAERLIDAQAERLEGLSGHVREERERVNRVESDLKNPTANEGVRLVEGALGKLANQLYEGEQRARDSMKDVREDMVGLSHRLTQMELRDPDRAAQALIDKVVTQLAQRLEQAEAQTSGAIKALEQAFTTLDARLSRAEERGDVTDPESVQSLQGLATELSRRVEDSRAELLNAMQDRSQTSTDELLKVLDRRIEETEHRSAAAIEKLGEDVMRIADNLNRRAGEVEKRTDEVEKEVRQIGTDLDAKIDSVVDAKVESRFDQGESSHAEALERLGAEIARISERLNSRISESERRAAQAIEGVGQFVEQSRDDSRNELTARIRQSEERTARQLEETRKTINNKLARVAAHSLLSESMARGGAAQARLRSDLPNPFETPAPDTASFDAESYDAPAYDAEIAKPAAQRVTFAPIQGGYEEDEPEDDQVDYSEADADAVEAYAPETHAAELAEPEADDADDIVADPIEDEAPAEIEAAAEDDHLDLTEPVEARDSFEDENDFNPFAPEDLDLDLEPAKTVQSPLGPRALRGSVAQVQSAVAALTDRDDDSDPFADIEVSRKTAPLRTAAPRTPVSFTPIDESRNTDDDDMDAFQPSRAPAPKVDEEAGISVSTRDALAAARAAVRASMDNTADTRGQGFNLQAGIPRARMDAARAAKVRKESGMLLNAFKASAVAVVVVAAAAGGYVALHSQQEPEQLAATAVTTAPDTSLLLAEYNSADKALKAHAPNAVAQLQKVADQGYPMAQFRLGSLYSGEDKYIKEDAVQARHWTEKAAAGGVTGAMYNLGLFYYNGYGGDKNPVLAATWFRKSAENGLFEGQYNLGLLYQQGNGVPLDPSEAYKWLKLAAKNRPSDREAVAGAAQARAQLSDEQAQRVDEAVQTFVPKHTDADPSATPAT